MAVPRATPDQVVAYNLARARELRGWTQPKAASEVAKHLGSEPWSPAVWSAAERSVTSDRVREFTASEIVAFALAFELPIAWFFLEPGPDFADAGTAPLVNPSRESRRGTTLQPGRLLDLVANVGDPDLRSELARRLEHLDRDEQTHRLQALTDAGTLLAASQVERLLGDPATVAKNLRELADHIGNLPFEAGRARGALHARIEPWAPSPLVSLDDPALDDVHDYWAADDEPRPAKRARKPPAKAVRPKKANTTTKKATRRPK